MKQIMIFSLIALMGYSFTTKAQTGYLCKTYEEYVKATNETDLSKYFTYERESKIFYMLANDKKHLYVRSLIADETLQKKILAFGNTVWIDINGGKKKKQGIQFPVIDSKKRPQPPKPGQKDDFASKKYEIIKNLTTAKLVGFSGENSETMIDINSGGQYEIKIYFDKQGNLVQEFKIPLLKLSPEFSPFNNPEFSLGFTTGFLNTSQMQPPPGGNNQQGHPSGGAAPSKEMEELTVQTKLWITKIKLNNK